MGCKSCGAEIPDGARFCPECGHDQSAAFPPEQRIQTPNVNVPRPQSSPTATGFGAGFGAALGWILGGCVVLMLLFVLTFGGCAILAGLGSQ